MKALKFIILTLFVFNLTVSTKFIQKATIDDQKLPKSICKITNDITSSKTDTQDILIGNVGSQV